MGFPVGLLKQLMPYTEFLTWQAYLDNEMNTPGKTEYYLAQIAAEVRRFVAKDPKSPKLADFLNPVKFIRKSQKQEKIDRRLEANRAKAFWFAATGLIGKGKNKKRKR